MGTSLKEMPDNVKEYVIKGTYAVNVVLLLCHLFFGVLFYLYDATFLFWFNCASIIIYILAFEILRRKQSWLYVLLVFVEIFIFMVICVVCLGWDYGFQHYCISFVGSMVFSDFFLNQNRVMTVRTIMLGAFNVVVYLLLRFWTYEHPYIYEIDNKFIVHSFYIFNTIIGFTFLIMYVTIYSKTVYKLENELRDIASIDPLTGLFNRRRMMSTLKEIPKTEYSNLTVGMMDVDFFKNTNDTYGHDAGDEVLRRIADVLKNIPNNHIQGCRWGGEEFLILYTNNTGNNDEIINEFEKIRQTIENMKITYEDKAINATVTIGVTICKNTTDIEAIIKNADEMLYNGKEQGRNRVVFDVI